MIHFEKVIENRPVFHIRFSVTFSISAKIEKAIENEMNLYPSGSDIIIPCG